MYYQKIKELDIDDIDKLSAAELKNIVSSGRNVLIQRQAQFERTHITSPAFNKFDPRALKVASRKSTLQSQAKLVVEKLNEQTSTRAGYREWKKNVKAAMGLSDKRISENKMKELWEAFDKFRENNPNLENVRGSDKAVAMLVDVKYESVDDMISQLEAINRGEVEREKGAMSDEQYNILMGKPKKE